MTSGSQRGSAPTMPAECFGQGRSQGRERAAAPGQTGRGERIRTFDLLNPILGQPCSEGHPERALRPNASTRTLIIQPVEGMAEGTAGARNRPYRSPLARRPSLLDLPKAARHLANDGFLGLSDRDANGLAISAIVEMLPEFDAMTFRVLQASELTLAVGIGPDGDRRRLDS